MYRKNYCSTCSISSGVGGGSIDKMLKFLCDGQDTDSQAVLMGPGLVIKEIVFMVSCLFVQNSLSTMGSTLKEKNLF